MEQDKGLQARCSTVLDGARCEQKESGGTRAGRWGLLMGRSCTMLRLGPRQVKVRKGFGTEGASPGMGTDRMASFTCMHAHSLQQSPS